MTIQTKPVPISGNATVWELLSAQARVRGTATAVEAQDRSPLSWAALIDQIERTRVALRGFGIGPADRVAAVLPDGPEAAVAFLSVCCSATVVPLNPAHHTSELALYLEYLQVRAMMVPTGCNSEIVRIARNRGCAVIELTTHGEAAGAFDLSCDTGTSCVNDFQRPSPQTPALVLQTSGTTSRPKIVPLSHANICASAHHVVNWLKLGPDDRCLVVTPPFHVNGLIRSVLSPLVAGGTVICTPGFQALHFLEWLDDYNPTWYTAVPPVHQAIVEQAQKRASHPIRSTLRFIRSGAAPLPTNLMMELERIFDVPVVQGYGMTEAASQIACNPLPPGVRKPGSIGLPAGPEMAVVNDNGQVVHPGQTGEIIVRGPNVMTAYEGPPEVNAKAFVHGWFRTGDQGYCDADGYYFVTGRLKELINRGGQKVSPREVDDVLMDHPSVREAATFPIPDGRLGEAVAAAVVLHPDRTLTERQLAEFAACRLAFFKVPDRILFVHELPKGPTGKVKRSMLADHFGLSDARGSDHPADEDSEESGWQPEEFVVLHVVRTAAEVLGVDDLDRHRSFLESGGDSIRAMLFVARLSEMFGVELSFLDVFHASSLVAIARTITTRVLDQLDTTEAKHQSHDSESR